ncbi:MAG: heat shock protein GrpE [Actinobacteria bacterium ADurb.Bin444]|nr:MAG: heat shock protein GrpE [Actinobacteria bacterium ADurb.Bin444]
MEKAVAEASRARDEYLDGLQRLQAEFDNYRRRVRREMNEASDTARVALLADFLPVLDNLERALSAAEHHEEGKVLEGVRLTRSQFVELLRREGVEEVDPLGGTFDPTVHEAMLARPADEPEGTVVDVFEKGYTVGGTRVLRPARVVVSSGTSSTAD